MTAFLGSFLRPTGPELVSRLIARAGIEAVPESETEPASLGSELIVVFVGQWRADLDVYDRNGRDLGTAARIKDTYSQVGYRYHYELRDTQLRWEVRDVTPRRFGVGAVTRTFSVHAPHGGELGTIALRRDSCAVEHNGARLATVKPVPRREARSARRSAGRPIGVIEMGHRLADGRCGRAWRIEDELGRAIAQLTYLTVGVTRVGYVLKLADALVEPLRPFALALSIVMDNAVTDRRGGGG